VYVGLFTAFAQLGTVGSVSVKEVKYQASFVKALTLVGTVGITVSAGNAPTS
jgi:hypothetical protein